MEMMAENNEADVVSDMMAENNVTKGNDGGTTAWELFGAP